MKRSKQNKIINYRRKKYVAHLNPMGKLRRKTKWIIESGISSTLEDDIAWGRYSRTINKLYQTISRMKRFKPTWQMLRKRGGGRRIPGYVPMASFTYISAIKRFIRSK